MPLSQDLRGSRNLLFVDNVCWQCKFRLQQRFFCFKAASGSHATSRETRKTVSIKQKLCAKKGVTYPRTHAYPVSRRMWCSTAQVHGSNRAQEFRVGGNTSLSLLEDSLSKSGTRFYANSEFGPASVVSTSNDGDGCRLLKAFNPQTPTSPSLNLTYGKPEYSQAYSAKEGTCYILPRKIALRQVRASINFQKIRQRSYGTVATATITNDHTAGEYTTSQNEFNQLPESNSTKLNIRERLRTWQDEWGQSPPDPGALDLIEDRGITGQMQNTITRPPSEARAHNDFNRDQVDGGIDIPNYNEDNIPDTRTSQIFLRQGDLVDIRLNGTSIPAIFLRNVEDQQIQVYTARGKWVNMTAQHIYFSIPGFVPRSAILSLLPYIPKTTAALDDLNKLQSAQVPREVGAPLIDAMLKFSQDADDEYRQRADQLDNAFEITARQVESRYATTLEIAMESLKETDASKISGPLLYAVHRALLNDDIGFHLDLINHRVSGLFEIIPKREFDLIKQVRAWLRQYQETLVLSVASSPATHQKKESVNGSQPDANPFPDFLRKVRRIISKSRERRSLTVGGMIGPCAITQPVRKPPSPLVSLEETGEKFTEQESVILKFLDYWTVQKSFSMYSAITSLGPLILRATGMYEGLEVGGARREVDLPEGLRLDEAIGFTFLQELGVIAPWQNRVSSLRRLALPGQNTDIRTDRLMSATIKTISTFEPKDSMKHIRRDWGELDVFCIDRAEAMEIDDGVSLEEIKDNQTSSWVHIHVANPTSSIPPDHPMARWAAHLTETVYLPEKVTYMISPTVTQGYFSLANGRPSLTFSAKLNLSGEILDIKVTSGIVRNVHYLTPQSVESALAKNQNSLSTSKNITVGGHRRPTIDHESKKLTSSQVITLRKLQQLGKARRRLREKEGITVPFLKAVEPSVMFDYSGNGRIVHFAKYVTARFWSGDPVISMDYRPWDPIIPLKSSDDPEVDMLVPDLMILSCEIAALWCSQRNIPVLYRGSEVNPELPPASRYKEEFVDASVRKHGYHHILHIMNYLNIIGRSKTMSEPIKHTIIGSDAYTKVTSPLRRYGDMVAHWQIEAAIRREAETGKSLIGSVDTSYLPFSRAKIDNMLPRVSERERLILKAKHNANRHWTVMLMFRAFHFKEAELPSIFRLFITENIFTRHAKRGILQEFGIEATLFEDDLTRSEGGIRTGDWWECKIRYIIPYHRQILMVPTRLIERIDFQL